jgi:hypothetical protein
MAASPLPALCLQPEMGKNVSVSGILDGLQDPGCNPELTFRKNRSYCRVRPDVSANGSLWNGTIPVLK